MVADDEGEPVGAGSPGSMRAAVYRGPGVVEVVEVDVPRPGPGEVLVEVDACGICGTDLHSVLEGWGRPDSIGGHEWSGRVVEVGDGVDGVAVDDLVVGGPDPGCGSCRPCEDRRPSLCADRNSPGVAPFQGAFADYVRIRADRVVPVPTGLDAHTAAFAEPLAVSLHAITQAAVASGDRVLVTGGGPIGAGIVAVLAAAGHEVVVSEPSPMRAELALALGAARVLDPGELTLPPMPNDVHEAPFDRVFECSGVRAAIETGLGQLRRGGRFVVVGTGLDFPRLDINRVLLNELEITGAFNYDEGGFPAALDLLASGALPTDALIEADAVGLDTMLGAMQALAAGRVAGKVLVRPGAGHD